MRTPFLLLKCIGKALLKVIGGGIVGDLLIETLPEVAKESWDAWSKEKDREAQRKEMEAIVQAGVDQIREQVAEIKQAIAPNTTPEIQLTVESYLTQVPAMVRKSLRRPSDPTGTTVSTDLVPKKADDLLAFLPPKLPRFKRGDRPLIGVDWELEELLGVGGFGEVWKARNPHMTSAPPVALKFCLDATAAKVLRNEAAMLDRVMRQGKHPGIVQLQHTYLSSETPCLEYEYVEGGDLAGVIHEWHRSGEKPKPEQAAKLILQLAEIVGFAHRQNPPIVHRDLKPANILVKRQEDGEIGFKVADFGIGGVAASQAIQQTRRETTRGELLATAVRGSYTPLYASPQQMRGEQPDPRDDVFALGVIWYQLLTGDLANGRPGGTRWHKRLTEQGVSSEMVDLMGACFEDDPDDRSTNAAKLASDISTCVQSHLSEQVVKAPSTLTPLKGSTAVSTFGKHEKESHSLAEQQGTKMEVVVDRKPSVPPSPTQAVPAVPTDDALFINRLQGWLEDGNFDLIDEKIGDSEVAALVASPQLSEVTRLDLSYNRIGDRGAASIASSPNLGNLEELVLVGNRIRDSGLISLANSSCLPNLTDLSLGHNKITSVGVSVLASASCFPNLHALSLYDNNIGDAGVSFLANSSFLSNLDVLGLASAGIGNGGAVALANSPYLVHLTRIYLEKNGIGDEGAIAFSNSPFLAEITDLRLNDNPIGAAGIDALRRRFGKIVSLRR